MTILLLLLLIVPILNWIAIKCFANKTKPAKRLLFWFSTTWIYELIVFISYVSFAM